MNESKTSSFLNELPKDYVLYEKINLSEIKTVNKIQYVFIGVAALMFILARLLNFPLSSSYEGWLTAIITISLCLVYLFLHELTHGLFIKLISHQKPKYNLKFPYLTTGTSVYLSKKSFIVICLAPVIVWGFILTGIILLVPESWFLIIYIVLIVNFGGSAGDYFQFFHFIKVPKDAYLKDDGDTTAVYSKNRKKK